LIANGGVKALWSRDRRIEELEREVLKGKKKEEELLEKVREIEEQLFIEKS